MRCTRRALCGVGLVVLLLAAPGWAEDPAQPAPVPHIEERWDFYPARINNADASVLLNVALHGHAPLKTQPTLLWVLLDMKAPDKHGMGTAAEVARMTKLGDAVVERLESELRARQVARIRGEGVWQLYFYAPAAKDLEKHVHKALPKQDKKTIRVGSKADPTWKYYLDFLWPKPKQLRWMRDRALVDAQRQAGDDLSKPRVVEHFAYFADAAKRSAFEKKIAADKFEVVERAELADDIHPFVLRFQRTDKIELMHIHRVADALRVAALALGGTYEGWKSAAGAK